MTTPPAFGPPTDAVPDEFGARQASDAPTPLVPTLTRAQLEIALTLRGLSPSDVGTFDCVGFAMGELEAHRPQFRLASGATVGDAAHRWLAVELTVQLPDGPWTGDDARYAIRETVIGPYATRDELDTALTAWMEPNVYKPMRRRKTEAQQQAAAARKAARAARGSR